MKTKDQTPSRSRRTQIALLCWCLFIGVGAVFGAIGMIADPTGKAIGMDAMLPYFQKLPFSEILFKDYLFPGFALLIVNAIPNLTASLLLIMKKKSGIVLGMIFGITLMLWICIQFYMFPLNFMSTIYFVFGLIQFLTGYTALVFYKQEQFHFDIADYSNIGIDPKSLVVYFSRMGYTRKLAYETANASGAVIYEITTQEPIHGTSGFWWCGRFGMHRWEMPINHIDIDLTEFEQVTICTPIWVFRVAAPVRSFCKQAKGKIKNVDYILCHYQNGNYEKAVYEIDQLLGVHHKSVKNVCCKVGKYI